MNTMHGLKSLLGRMLPVVLLLAAVSPLQSHAPDPEPVQKHVVVDKANQTLSAYEGRRLVFQCRISSGRWDRSTPNGIYVAGDKFRMHYSRLYHNAAMPYSVYVTGNVFIHGFSYVPAWPASHGCIRLPMDGPNMARRFFEWVEPGTPIVVTGHWKERRITSYTF